jgi:hypothetical protein
LFFVFCFLFLGFQQRKFQINRTKKIDEEKNKKNKKMKLVHALLMMLTLMFGVQSYVVIPIKTLPPVYKPVYDFLDGCVQLINSPWQKTGPFYAVNRCSARIDAALSLADDGSFDAFTVEPFSSLQVGVVNKGDFGRSSIVLAASYARKKDEPDNAITYDFSACVRRTLIDPPDDDGVEDDDGAVAYGNFCAFPSGVAAESYAAQFHTPNESKRGVKFIVNSIPLNGPPFFQKSQANTLDFAVLDTAAADNNVRAPDAVSLNLCLGLLSSGTVNASYAVNRCNVPIHYYIAGYDLSSEPVFLPPKTLESAPFFVDAYSISAIDTSLAHAVATSAFAIVPPNGVASDLSAAVQLYLTSCITVTPTPDGRATWIGNTCVLPSHISAINVTVNDVHHAHSQGLSASLINAKIVVGTGQAHAGALIQSPDIAVVLAVPY